jgi:hypothetical protein
MNRQTPTATHSRRNVQIQRGLPGIEEWQGSWQNGGRLQHGIEIAHKAHCMEPPGSVKVLHGVNLNTIQEIRAKSGMVH